MSNQADTVRRTFAKFNACMTARICFELTLHLTSPLQQPTNSGLSRFAAFGSSLRQQAAELQQKASQQAAELQAKAQMAAQQVTSTAPAAAAAPDTPTSLTNLKSDEYSKEYLMEMMQKMNKKIKALTLLRQQLTERVETVEADKQQLQTLVVEEILNGAVEPTDDVAQLRTAWRQLDEQNALNLQQLQAEFQKTSRQQSNGETEWQQEKQALMEAHQRELAALQTADKTDAIQNVKAAAQEQLAAFQKKVAAARQEELAKLKQQLADEAKAELDQKLAAQAQEYEAKLQSTTTANDELKATHAANVQRIQEEAVALRVSEIENERQRVEQSVTTEMEEKLQDAVGELRREHQQELERVRSEATAASQEQLQQELAQAKQQHEQVVQALQQQLDGVAVENGSMLQTQLQETTTQLEAAEEREQSLMAQLDDVKSKLAAVENEIFVVEASNSSKVEQALSDQQALYKANLAELESKHAEQLLALQQNAQQTTETRVSTLESQLRESSEKLAVVEKERVDQVATLQKQLEESRELAKATAAEQETAHKSLENSRDGLVAEIESTKKVLADLENAKNNELASLAKQHESALADVVQQLQDKTRELGALSSSDAQQSSAYSELQSTYEELQTKYKMLETSVASESSTLQSELETLRVEKAQMESAMTKTQSELEQIKESSAKDIEERRARVSDAAKQNEEEVRQVIASFEKKLQEASKTEGDVSESLETLKAEHARTLQTSTETFKQQIQNLETEIAALKETQQSAAQSLTQRERELGDMLAARESKIEELSNQLKQLFQSLENKESAIKTAQEEHESAISKLSADLKATQELVNAASTTSGEELAANLDELQAQNVKEITELSVKHDAEMKAIRDELETARVGVENDLTKRMEKQKGEFEEQINNTECKHEEEKEQMRKSMEKHVDSMNLKFKEKLASVRAEYEAVQVKLKQESSEKEKRLASLSESLKKQTAAATTLQSSNEAMKATLATAVSKEKKLQAEIAALRKEIKDAVSSNNDTASELLQQQELLEKEKNDLLEQLKKLKTALNGKSNKVEELSGKLEALTANLNAMAEEERVQNEKLKVAATNEARLKVSEAEVVDLREQINKLKLDMNKNASLVTRLQAEKEISERSQGERTALVGMLESQLSEMSDKNADINAKLEAALYDLSQKEETIDGHQEQVRKLESELAEAAAATKRVSDALAVAHKGADANSLKKVEALQKELQVAKQQMSRKSAAAQRLLQEREQECTELRQTMKALKNEVDKGSLSDRKIFELAEKQSNRDSSLASDVVARDRTIERLKEALLSRDGDLASVEMEKMRVECEVEELCRVRRREDVNLDYLKSVVVQYLSLPTASSERARLLPVLATLLQFDPKDYRIIEEGKNKIGWWGSVAPTLISDGLSPSATPVPAALSAEVNVVHHNNQKSRTSLQF
jgi:chromosome segregation ATPase